MPPKIDDAYRKAHQCCPNCLGVNVWRTLTSFNYVPDENRARCEGCQWVGIVDDLVPNKEA